MNLIPIKANMNEVTLNNNIKVLFSYKTPVACEINGELYKTNKFWSKTTTRHINSWLDGRNAEEAFQTFFDTLTGE